MQKFIISLFCCLLPALACAEAPQVRDNAPDRHVVVKGDTLWDISAEFFKDPWKWPEIWGLNKESIKDPHWIYPGDVIVLDRATGTLKVNAPVAEPSGGSPNEGVVKLSPSMRSEASAHDAIPVIPYADIAPFLNRALVVGPKGFQGAPVLAASYEQRVILGTGDIAYVKGLHQDKGTHWQVYRAGKEFRDPDSGESLGREAIYLGDAEVEKFADLSTVRIVKAVQEIGRGDNLYQPTDAVNPDYLPHAPESKINAKIISVYGGLSQAGQYTVVTINKGRRDGLENGHVLALYHRGGKEGGLVLPDIRYGLLFVFRTFDRVSYGLVMHSTLPAELLDRAQTP